MHGIISKLANYMLDLSVSIYFLRRSNKFSRLIYHIISHFFNTQKDDISTKMYFCIAVIGRIFLLGTLSLLTRPGPGQ